MGKNCPSAGQKDRAELLIRLLKKTGNPATISTHLQWSEQRLSIRIGFQKYALFSNIAGNNAYYDLFI
ncbi:MAG: hypothetical protein ACNA8K_16055 [Cyclonatronaceae bacterium]